MISKVTHGVSEILHQPHDNEEDVRQRSEVPQTQDDDKVSMTRVMFKDIIAKAREEQKSLADANSQEAIKVAFTEGVKHASDLQTQPLHSLAMESETICQSPIRPSEEYGLNAVHLLRLSSDTAIALSSVNNTMPVQQVANIQYSLLSTE